MKVLAPYVITESMLTYSSVPEDDYSPWDALTEYAAGQRAIRTTTHRVYERLTPGVTAGAPDADTENWVEVGPTNRWAMLDDSVGSSTSAVGSVSVSIAPGGPVNDLVLLGVAGGTYTVQVNGATVRSGSVPPAASAALGSTIVLTGLGAAGAPSINVTVAGSGKVSIGTLCLGTFYTLGQPEKGAQVGVIDYSKKTFDEFGQATIAKRGYSRKVSTNFTAPPSSLDTIDRVLTALRSKAAVWQSLTWVDAAVVYGIVSDRSLTLDDGVVRGSVTVKSLAFGL